MNIHGRSNLRTFFLIVLVASVFACVKETGTKTSVVTSDIVPTAQKQTSSSDSKLKLESFYGEIMASFGNPLFEIAKSAPIQNSFLKTISVKQDKYNQKKTIWIDTTDGSFLYYDLDDKYLQLMLQSKKDLFPENLSSSSSPENVQSIFGKPSRVDAYPKNKNLVYSLEDKSVELQFSFSSDKSMSVIIWNQE